MTGPPSSQPPDESPNPKPKEDEYDDAVLAKSEYLTHREFLKRRSNLLKRLTKVYKDYYWDLLKEIRVKYREYVRLYGRSPYEDDDEDADDNDEDEGPLCEARGCKAKAMPLTKFCCKHILNDDKQVLYKPCKFIIKSSQTGPILCGTPILSAAIPSLCTLHMQKAENYVARALKQAGHYGNYMNTSKPAPKFPQIVEEYFRQIQTKRRAAPEATVERTEIMEED